MTSLHVREGMYPVSPGCGLGCHQVKMAAVGSHAGQVRTWHETTCPNAAPMPGPVVDEVPRVGAVVVVHHVDLTRSPAGSRVLVIRRANDPKRGHWALPGGKLNLREHVPAAALRELREETGLALQAEDLTFVGWYESIGDLQHRVVFAYAARFLSEAPPEVVAGDDAEEARFLTREEVRQREAEGILTPLTRAVLRDAGWLSL